jgi:hypothetical protein
LVEEGENTGIVHISLDTDPNEDSLIVKKHIEENNLNWLFAISPIELTRSLITELGISFVNAPSAPVALLCPDNKYRMLKNGVKTSDQLKVEIEKGC